MSFLALTLGLLAATTASAAVYEVNNDAELRRAIADANNDSDATATIIIKQNFAMTADLPVPSKPMTIDTGVFTLSDITATHTGGKTLTLSGRFQGDTGQRGLWVKQTVLPSSVINNGSILGGTDGPEGVLLAGPGTFVNNGTVAGGSSRGAVAGGTGIRSSRASTIINNGIIQAGSSATGSGGTGANLGGIVNSVTTLTNNGTIRGGDGVNSAATGIGVRMVVSATLINNGIEGGNNAYGVVVQSTSNLAKIVNNGTIRAGAGQPNAIVTNGAAQTLDLELQAGSVIEGNVIGGVSGSTDNLLHLGGTADGVFDVSKVGQQYQNFDVFDKIGTGTWALTGTGGAATDWDIKEGTLAIGNGGTSGSVLGTITDNGTLAFNRSDSFAFGNTVVGSGTIRQIGSGTTTLTADNSAFAGTTSVEAGTLSVNGSLGGTLDVLTGGRLQGTGSVGDTANTGIIAPGNSIGTLTIDGDYTGNGGTLEVESALGDDASPTDRLVITGNTAGNTNVRVINRGGAGAPTVEGIKIIDVGGSSDGTFALQGDYVLNGRQAVVAGAYGYSLFQNGVSTPADGDWYLRSALVPPTSSTPGGAGPAMPLYQPGAPLYENYAQNLQVLNGLGTMQQRVGNRYWARAGSAAIAEGDGPGTPEAEPLPSKSGRAIIDTRAIWARIEGAHARVNPKTSTTGSDYDYDTWRLQSGVDGKFYDNPYGALVGGVTFQYGEVSSDISSPFGNGSIDTDGYGFGGTLTWLGQDGFYVDTQAQLTWYDSDITSDTLHRSLTDGNDGFGYAFSAETGRRLAIGDHWTIVPQAQLAYSNVDFDDFTDPFGAGVSADNNDSLKGRLGLSADYQNSWADASGRMTRTNIYGMANLYYEFLDGYEVNLAGVNFANENDQTWGGIAGGGTLSFADDKYVVYGEVSLNTSLSDFADSYSVNGTTGFKIRF